MVIARPTAGGILFSALAAAALGSAFINAGLMTAIGASVLCTLVAASFVTAHFSLRKISVERTGSADTPGGSMAVCPLRITNRSRLYRQPLVVREKFDFYLKKTFRAMTPPLAPHESIELFREIPADRRGHVKLDTVWLSGGDPCGFFRQTKVFHLPGEITITPRITELSALPVSRFLNMQESGEGHLLGRAGLGGDFFGIRAYRPGDEIRHIDWRGSAARNKLMVKEFEASITDRIHILLESGPASAAGQDDSDSNFEHLISAAASIAHRLSSRYCQLYFSSGLDSGTFIHHHGEAAGVRGKIIEALTELQLSDRDVQELFCEVAEHLRPGDTLFLLTMEQSDELCTMMTQLTNIGVLVNWIYAPAENFPPREPDVPRLLPNRRITINPLSPVEPVVLNFQSDLSELLKSDEPLEKI